MATTLQYIIQWVRSGAPKAKDPRLSLLNQLYKSSTLDPHTLKIIQTPEKVTVKATLLYSTPDLTILKRQKKLVIIRSTKDLVISLSEAAPSGAVLLTHDRSMFELSLEEVLVLCNLYVIFRDTAKMKLFQQLINQGE